MAHLQLTTDQTEILLEIFSKGLVALDLETTGLSALTDRIVEMAAVRLHPNGKLDTFTSLINPGIEIPTTVTKIHGISDEMVGSSPHLSQILPSFLEFIGDRAIVAHNAKFDLGFIIYAIHQLQLPIPQNPVYCSIQLARNSFQNMPNNKLGTLAEQLGFSFHCQHRALDDSYICLKVFSHALMALKEKGSLDKYKSSHLFNLKDFCRLKDYSIPNNLQNLKEYIQNQTEIEIMYKGGSVRNKFRPVRPVALLPLPSSTILYALCLISNQHKSFKLAKITAFRARPAPEKTHL